MPQYKVTVSGFNSWMYADGNGNSILLREGTHIVDQPAVVEAAKRVPQNTNRHGGSVGVFVEEVDDEISGTARVYHPIPSSPPAKVEVTALPPTTVAQLQSDHGVAETEPGVFESKKGPGRPSASAK
jgi:hypothetical protein